MAESADYAWVRDSLLDNQRGYCIGLVQALSPAEILERLSASGEGTCVGLTELFHFNDAVRARLKQEGGAGQLVGAALTAGADGGWAVVVEFGTVIGADDQLMATVSAGTQVVTNHLTSAAEGGFGWWCDGQLLAGLERPGDWGTEVPDALAGAIDRVGVGLADSGRVEWYFAVAEELTGVRLTCELLEHAAFSTGVVAVD